MDRKAAFHHGLDDGTVRNLDGDPDRLRFGACPDKDPGRHFRQAGSAVTESPPSRHLASAVDNADLMGLRTPVDPGKLLKHIHGIPFASLCQRTATMPSCPCTGTQGTSSLLGVHRGQGPRHRPPRCSWRRGRSVALNPLTRPILD